MLNLKMRLSLTDVPCCASGPLSVSVPPPVSRDCLRIPTVDISSAAGINRLLSSFPDIPWELNTGCWRRFGQSAHGLWLHCHCPAAESTMLLIDAWQPTRFRLGSCNFRRFHKAASHHYDGVWWAISEGGLESFKGEFFVDYTSEERWSGLIPAVLSLSGTSSGGIGRRMRVIRLNRCFLIRCVGWCR